MESLEVREFRYFVAVAEELNFSRAAARLGIAQPPLSRAIRRIERRIGADLFHRDTHRVTLTPAGATLLTEARTVIDVVHAATRRTQRAALTEPALVVTAKPGVAARMLRRVVEAYGALPGTSRVEIVVSGFGDQGNLVRDGRADAALLSSPYEQPGLDTEPLATEPRVAALPADHPLASRAVLRIRDLAGEPVPRWAQASPAEHAYWSGRDVRLPGAEPTPTGPTGPIVSDVAQLLEVVGLGQAVALVPRSLADAHPRPDIAYRPVLDASPYTIAIAWPAGSRDPALARLVRTAMTVCTGTP